MNDLKAICFDMGDTLVETRPSIVERVQGVLEGCGMLYSRGAAGEALGRAWLAMGEEYMARDGHFRRFWMRLYKTWLKELGIDKDLDGLMEQISESFVGLQHDTHLPGEVLDILAGLRDRGYRLGIISNWDPSLRAYCRELGIADHFTCILASGAVGVGKPSPGIFEMALERLGVAPEEALHVGDNYYADVLGAKRVGMQGILLDRLGVFGYADCDRIEELRDLLSILPP